MRKKDIVSIILADDEIAKNERLLSVIRDKNNYEIPEKYWYPDIPKLKQYFDILKKEILYAKKQTK